MMMVVVMLCDCGEKIECVMRTMSMPMLINDDDGDGDDDN
jgi:hypothetical protein